MSIFTLLTKFDHKFYETLHLCLMDGSFMSKKYGEILSLKKTATFGAKNLPQQIPSTCSHNNHRKPPIHISVVINSIKPIGMSTIFL